LNVLSVIRNADIMKLCGSTFYISVDGTVDQGNVNDELDCVL